MQLHFRPSSCARRPRGSAAHHGDTEATERLPPAPPAKLETRNPKLETRNGFLPPQTQQGEQRQESQQREESARESRETTRNGALPPAPCRLPSASCRLPPPTAPCPPAAFTAPMPVRRPLPTADRRPPSAAQRKTRNPKRETRNGKRCLTQSPRSAQRGAAGKMGCHGWHGCHGWEGEARYPPCPAPALLTSTRVTHALREVCMTPSRGVQCCRSGCLGRSLFDSRRAVRYDAADGRVSLWTPRHEG